MFFFSSVQIGVMYIYTCPYLLIPSKQEIHIRDKNGFVCNIPIVLKSNILGFLVAASKE